MNGVRMHEASLFFPQNKSGIGRNKALFTAAAEYIDQFAAIVAVEVRYLAQRVLGRSKLFRAADRNAFSVKGPYRSGKVQADGQHFDPAWKEPQCCLRNQTASYRPAFPRIDMPFVPAAPVSLIFPPFADPCLFSLSVPRICFCNYIVFSCK